MTEHKYYGHGKLLLTGEYFVLDGAKSLALPTKQGQSLNISYRPSANPTLIWKSYNADNKIWYETRFEMWHINCIAENADDPTTLILQKILRQARKQNIHFLREECDIYVHTYLEFDKTWGLGSSSTLVYNIAQWAYVSPFELLAKTFEGSGYDIACAQSVGPITYQLVDKTPQWKDVKFHPVFHENIYFVHLNKKQNSREGIEHYRKLDIQDRQKIIKDISFLTEHLIDAITVNEFQKLMDQHEKIISKAIDLPLVSHTHFVGFSGAVKSLGAWGGDFVMLCSSESPEYVFEYCQNKGLKQVVKYSDMILNSSVVPHFQKTMGGQCQSL